MKTVEARERKPFAMKDDEDSFWQDDDKQLAKKNAKREEKERKKDDLLRKKAENKALLDQELAAIKTTAKPSIQKVTQAQIQLQLTDRIVKRVPLEENLNRFTSDTFVASTVEEAISVLR